MSDFVQHLDRVIAAMQKQARDHQDDMTLDDLIRQTVCDTGCCLTRSDTANERNLRLIEESIDRIRTPTEDQ